MNIKNNYIPQIDGLRAIAVLSVILFHANFEILNINFAGGYFGVDIFFVISGYLITKLIVNEIKKENNFNFKNFYLRRIRRIIPALLTVAIVSYPFAWLLLLPVPFLEYIGSLISGIFFSSNLFFYFTEAEYNAIPSLYKPLLHYWSLSVEEQFYILYPLSLFLIYKYFKKNLILFFTIIAFLSFILSLYLSLYNSSLNFYLFPTRIWELLVGAFAAKLHIENNKFINNKSHLFLQLLGTTLIAISILYLGDFTTVWINNTTLSKLLLSDLGLMTLIPVIGTFLIIIFTNQKNLINKFLSLKPIVFIGLISYSLYLWHVPIFSLIRISTIDLNSPIEYLLLIVFIFVLSILSYYLIEKPFRNKNITSLKKLFFYLFLIITILLSLSFHAFKNKGYSNIVPGYFKEFKISDKAGNPLFEKENIKNNLDESNITHKEGNPLFETVLLIGDSHAGNFKEEIEKELISRKKNLISLGYSNIFSLDLINVLNNGKKKSLDKEINTILDKKNVSTIILISRFPVYWHRSGFDSEQGPEGIEILNDLPYFLDSNYKRLQEEKRKEIIEKSFNRSVLEILNKNINVIIMYPVPEAGFWVPNVLAARVLPRLKVKYLFNQFFDDSAFLNLPKNKYITTSYELYLKRNKDVFKMLDKIEHPNLFRIYPQEKLCNKQLKNRCITHTEKSIYYRDNNHLSIMGRKLIMPELIDIFDKIK